MKAIVTAVWISSMSLIFAGCSTAQCSPQIVKVPQKVTIKTPPLPEVINPKEVCDRNDSDCISAIAAYNFTVLSEFAATYDVTVKAYK